MKNKVWHKIVISTEEQNVEIYPTDTFVSIIVQAKESDGSISNMIYLNEDEMDLLILKMREMMYYLKEDKQ